MSVLALSAILLCITQSSAQQIAPIDIGSRLELFVDDYLVDQFVGEVKLHLHKPVGKEVVLKIDKPWEDPTAGYFAVYPDGDKFCMYYRGRHHGSGPIPRGEPMCYAESKDGIHWVKPNLGLFSFEGSSDNNIVIGGDDAKYPATKQWRGNLGFDTDLGWRGDVVPFKDESPNVTPDAQYKALMRGCRGPHQVLEGQSDYGMYPMKSPDGIHWTLIRDKPVITKLRFDTQNLAFWDAPHKRYVAFLRDLKYGTEEKPLYNAPTKEQFEQQVTQAIPGVWDVELITNARYGSMRDICVSYSDDFVNWTKPVPLQFPGDIDREMYTNAIFPYERAPHILLGFPTALDDVFAVDQVYPIFMSSRDGGASFLRHGEPLIPCEAPRERDGDRSNYMARGLIRGNEREYFVYATEGYGYEESDSPEGWRKSEPPSARLRRFVYRVDGFRSARAGLSGGEVVTKPITFQGDELRLNYIAWPLYSGELRVEIQDADGKPLEGLNLDDCEPLHGDQIAQAVKWRSGVTPGSYANRPVRIRFQLRDADLFSFQFVAGDNADKISLKDH